MKKSVDFSFLQQNKLTFLLQFLQYFLKVPLFINLSKPEGNITQSTLRMIFVLWGEDTCYLITVIYVWRYFHT